MCVSHGRARELLPFDHVASITPWPTTAAPSTGCTWDQTKQFFQTVLPQHIYDNYNKWPPTMIWTFGPAIMLDGGGSSEFHFRYAGGGHHNYVADPGRTKPNVVRGKTNW